MKYCMHTFWWKMVLHAPTSYFLEQLQGLKSWEMEV